MFAAFEGAGNVAARQVIGVDVVHGSGYLPVGGFSSHAWPWRPGEGARACCRPLGSARWSSPSRRADAVLGHDCHDLGRVPAGRGGGMQGIEVVLQPSGGDDEQAADGAADTSNDLVRNYSIMDET